MARNDGSTLPRSLRLPEGRQAITCNDYNVALMVELMPRLGPMAEVMSLKDVFATSILIRKMSSSNNSRQAFLPLAAVICLLMVLLLVGSWAWFASDRLPLSLIGVMGAGVLVAE